MIITMNPVEIPGATVEVKRGTLIQMPGVCEHRHLTADENGEIITCKECKKQVSAYWLIKRTMSEWAEFSRKIKAQREQLDADLKKAVVLRAAQDVEKAWRRRKMVPTCPHCRHAILPTDGFGLSCVSRIHSVERHP
jgi:hypothetical protein